VRAGREEGSDARARGVEKHLKSEKGTEMAKEEKGIREKGGRNREGEKKKKRKEM